MKALPLALLACLLLSGCSGTAQDPRAAWIPALGSDWVLATTGDSMRADLEEYSMTANPGPANVGKFPAQDARNAPTAAYGGIFHAAGTQYVQLYSFVLDFASPQALDSYMAERDDCGKGANFFAWMKEGSRGLYVAAFDIQGKPLTAAHIDQVEQALDALATGGRTLVCTNQ